MKKREAAFTTKHRKWIHDTLPTCLWEVKHTRGKDTFPLREIPEHQWDWLLACITDKGVSYKIPDAGMSFNPSDGFNIKNAEGHFIIAYPKGHVVIDVRELYKYKKKSLSFEDACALAWKVVLY